MGVQDRSIGARMSGNMERHENLAMAKRRLTQ
jgi:hypothetical protein